MNQNCDPTEFDDIRLRETLHAICVLALDQAEQISYLQREGGFPEVGGLILDFEKYLVPGWLWGKATFTSSQLEAVTRLYGQLESLYPVGCSVPLYQGSVDDLALEGWRTVRMLARAALEEFGFQWGPDIRERLSATWPPGCVLFW